MTYNRYIDTIENKVSSILKKIDFKISFKIIFFILISFLLPAKSFLGSFFPFAYVLLAVGSVYDVPLIALIIPNILSGIVFNVEGFNIINLIAFFFVFSLITAFINIEGISKKNSVFVKFLISMVAVNGVINFFNGTLISELFYSLTDILIASIFYYIFIYGSNVAINFKKGFIFSKEEEVSFVVLLAVIISFFSKIDIGKYNLANIIVTALILIYSWKNDSITSVCAGFMTGLIYLFLCDTNISFPISLAVTGLISSVFSRFGKIPVLLGFIIGNIYISYFVNDFSDFNLRLAEIVFSSVVLLFMPKYVEGKVEKLFNKNKTIDKPYENVLDSADKIEEKVDVVTKIFDELSNQNIVVSKDEMEETRQVIKKYINDYIENNCISCLRRKACLDEERLNITVDYIAGKLEKNENINADMLYFGCNTNKEKIINNIKEIYDGIKITRILKRKENDASQKVNMQYKEVSNILSKIVKENKKENKKIDIIQEKIRAELKFYGYVIYEDEYVKDGDDIEYLFVTDILNNIEKQKKQILSIISNVFAKPMSVKLILNSSKTERSKIKVVSVPKFKVRNGIASATKTGEIVSGDSYVTVELQDLRILSAISDGAGSGIEASKSSENVILNLQRLLESGFSKESAIEIINSILKLKTNNEMFTTLDTMFINQKNGEAEFIKIASAPTYILSKGKITTIQNNNIPLGLVSVTDYIPIQKKLDDKDIIIQISDGVIKENDDKNENILTRYLKQLDTSKTSQNIADEILKLALKDISNIPDDITVIVTKLQKN